VLCTLRPLGPLWCLLAGVAVLVAVRPAPHRWRTLLTRWDVRLAGAFVVLSFAQNAAWTLHMGTLPLAQDGAFGSSVSAAGRVGAALAAVPVWLLQAIAAFPMRGATHPAVYGCYLVVFGALMVNALRAADTRLRLALAGVALVGLAVPVGATVRTYDALGGVAWQGRYTLPFLIGLVVLAAYALDRSGVGLPGPWPVVAGVLFVTAQVVSAAYTLHVEIGLSPLVHSPAWVRPPIWLVIVGSTIGATLVWWGTWPGRTMLDPSPAPGAVGRTASAAEATGPRP
jgi:hypothetical protein